MTRPRPSGPRDPGTIRPIVVDGDRPAVARVTALPAAWTTGGERIVLLAMAVDSFDGTTDAPGNDALAAWTGMGHGSVIAILERLCKPTEHRPALLARERSSRGRNRVVFRFLLPEPEEHRPGRGPPPW